MKCLIFFDLAGNIVQRYGKGLLSIVLSFHQVLHVAHGIASRRNQVVLNQTLTVSRIFLPSFFHFREHIVFPNAPAFAISASGPFGLSARRHTKAQDGQGDKICFDEPYIGLAFHPI